MFNVVAFNTAATLHELLLGIAEGVRNAERETLHGHLDFHVVSEVTSC